MPPNPSLILHIGLPKTGTTFLQKEFFPLLDSVGYLRKPKSDVLRGTIGAEYGLMHRCFRHSAVVWREYGDTIFEALFGCARAEFEAERTWLISDEGISMSGKSPFLLSCHLKELQQKAADWGFQRIRTICTIRRQDQWIASQYAQRSDRIRGARQKGFEEFVEEFLDPAIGYFRDGILLDYATLRQHVVAAVGTDNVLMLPFELLVQDPLSFMSVMARFIDDSAHLQGRLGAVATARHNVRSNRPDVWELRPPRSSRVLRLHPQAVLQKLGLPTRIPLRLPDPRRERSITLTEPLRARILSTYAGRNRALEAEIGLDLGDYGYH
jgi:hypothetical protein